MTRLIRTLGQWGSLLAASLALTACGGGGGSSSSNNSNELDVGPLTPTAIVRDIGDSAASIDRQVDLTASYSGTTTDPIYVVVVDPDGLMVSPWLDVSVPSKAWMSMLISEEAAAGHYTKPLTIHACRDVACQREYAGFPRTVSKDITLRGITTNVSSLHFTAEAGTVPPVQSITVSAPKGQPFINAGVVGSYVNCVYANGETSLQTVAATLQITQTATGFDIRPWAFDEGHCSTVFRIGSDAAKEALISLDWDSTPRVAPVLSTDTTEVHATAKYGSTDLVLVKMDILEHLSSSAQWGPFPGDPPYDPGWPLWLSTSYVYPLEVAGPDRHDLLDHQTLRFNACPYWPTCLPVGRYTWVDHIEVMSWDKITRLAIPVTFDITP